MELHQSRAFVQVARIENPTQAAERLHISASALSTQIGNFETELDLSLSDSQGGWPGRRKMEIIR
jgi:DNA-binding transcriptional LysR family regulator